MANRILRMRAFAPLFVVTAFIVRHVVKIFVVHTATRCLFGRIKKAAVANQCWHKHTDGVFPKEKEGVEREIYTIG